MEPPVADSDSDDDDDDDDLAATLDVTPLMEAAVLGDVAKIRQLISEGAEIDARDSDGDTALVYAVINGEDAAVSCLLCSGADIKVLGLLSIIGGEAKTVNAALLSACQYNSFVSVASALEMGANPNYPHPVTGLTPLMEAVRSDCDQDIIDLLLKKGADVYAIDTDGWNVFMWFAEDCGDTDIMSSLLSAAGPRMMPQIRNAAAAKKIQALWRGYHTRLTFAVKQ
jgi:ankyrin repeat protein